MITAKTTPLEKEIQWAKIFIRHYFENTEKSPVYFKILKEILRDVVKLVNGRTPITGVKRENLEIKIFLAQNARSLFKNKRITDINADMLKQLNSFLLPL